MRLEIYKDEEKLEFENVILRDYFDELELKIKEFKPHEFDFNSIHQMLIETNKDLLERTFQDEKKESR
jgi:hypothetical protein